MTPQNELSSNVAVHVALTTHASVGCLATLSYHVHVGVPASEGLMQANMRAIYSKQLAFFSTRGISAWKCPSLLGMIERGDVWTSVQCVTEWFPFREREPKFEQCTGQHALRLLSSQILHCNPRYLTAWESFRVHT